KSVQYPSFWHAVERCCLGGCGHMEQPEQPLQPPQLESAPPGASFRTRSSMRNSTRKRSSGVTETSVSANLRAFISLRVLRISSLESAMSSSYRFPVFVLRLTSAEHELQPLQA